MGDFNAKVGTEKVDDIVGKHGLGIRNERGKKLIEWCQTNNIIVGNTWFQQPPRRKWTWKNPGDETRNQIDYMMISKRYRNALLLAKTYPSADCYSDHVPVVGKFKLKLKKNSKPFTNIKFDLAILKTNQTITEKYLISVQNKFEALADAEEVEQQWENFKSAIMEAATEVIPKVKRKAKHIWMTEEILNLMEERRCAKGNKEKYEQIHKKVQEKCHMSKENWINEKCKEIEQQRKHAQQTMYRNIEEITGKRTFLSTGCIKAMNGDIIIDKEKILERWEEYIRELFKDDRKDHNIMKNNFAGPSIMKEEIETAIKKMKYGKATGPDNISVELIEALEDFGIGKVTHLLNEIYDTGQIPTDLSKSIFIALPKKPGATECELDRTISLMSHITKILLKIIMLRIRNKIKPEIAEEQCGFLEDKGTSNAIYILPTLIERALEVQKDVYLCFVDYTKAFDRVHHDEILKQLKQLNIDGKDLRIIKTMYWEQTAAMRIENKTSTFQDIKRGVRQGCVLSPDLFSLYTRTAQAKINFQKMKTILTNKHVSIETRKRALQCYIETVLMYGCEAWTISKQIQNKLEATEMWLLRRMLRISWTAKKTNERVMNEANKRRSLIRTIRKRQATFLGQVIRRGKLEHLVTTGKFEGKRSRGRQREKIMDGLATWLGPGKVSDILAAVKDRDLWRDMIANAYKQGT
ncbi:endonuclease-reverse transcriptase [Plakobranchus ocellatus]|uniref:Endonuclease-reverse transcriptase n=1 Tax=Plakobranchus ocellatus TaxID=259542 RepID=A0AAV4C0R7_9GAST|nr:endonuclease-reverse transcriptase [Plakobranchus ocellatus]